jgi:hypothetical protein
MILTRGLSLEERREQREREGRAAVEAGRQAGGPAAALQKLLEDVQKDLRADSAPMRARGVCSLTKVRHKDARQLHNQQQEGPDPTVSLSERFCALCR